MTIKQIGVIGGLGFVGSSIVSKLDAVMLECIVNKTLGAAYSWFRTAAGRTINARS
mgnify:CR=1 FL=1